MIFLLGILSALFLIYYYRLDAIGNIQVDKSIPRLEGHLPILGPLKMVFTSIHKYSFFY